jgi:hypothetical protein
VRTTGPIDWTRPSSAHERGSDAFNRILAEDGLLAAAIENVVAARGAAGDCESYPFMDKLVLWSSADRALRLRLHLFFPGYTDRPHNHRWSFLSRVLTGGYLHSLYGDQDDVLRRAQRGDEITARHTYQAPAGVEYFLDHSLVHSLHAGTVTVTLLLRGPSVKDEYFTLDGGVRWSSGAQQESSALRQTKTMTEEGYARVLDTLRTERVI